MNESTSIMIEDYRNRERRTSMISSADKEDPARCPLCGSPVMILYPEIRPGIRNATCRNGHKIKIQKGRSDRKAV